MDEVATKLSPIKGAAYYSFNSKSDTEAETVYLFAIPNASESLAATILQMIELIVFADRRLTISEKRITKHTLGHLYRAFNGLKGMHAALMRELLRVARGV